MLESLTSLHIFHRLILEHLLPHSNLCIDLIFTGQPNPEVHCSFHFISFHFKLNLNIEYPPSFEWLVWDSNRTQTDTINKQVSVFNDIITNIFSDFGHNL